MKKLVLGFILSAFAFGALSPVLVSTGAMASHENCKDGYYFDEDEDKCVRESRGSHD